MLVLLGGAVVFAGRALVVEDPLERADAIVVLDGTSADRALEAYDLYRAGYAPRIVFSAALRDAGTLALKARGVTLPLPAELAKGALAQLGVPESAMTVLEPIHNSTADEARTFAKMCAERGWRTLIVITSRFHTRRAKFAFARAFDESHVRVLMRSTRYDRSEPARWWTHRKDVQFVIAEWGKLIFYVFAEG